jgi:signal transduction histidine kinase
LKLPIYALTWLILGSGLSLPAKSRDWQAPDDNNPIIELTENWEFYWKSLLDPETVPSASPSAIVSLGRVWEGIELHDGTKVIRYGYATYRQVLKALPPDKRGYQIGLEGAGQAFKLIVFPSDRPDLAQVSGAGTVDKEHSQGSRRNAVIHIHPDKMQDYTVLIQVSNSSYAFGGAYFPLKIGLGDRLSRYYELMGLVNLCGVGVMIAVGVYSFMMWVRRKTDHPALMLALTSLAALVRAITTVPFILRFISDELYNPLLRLTYISLISAALCYVSFLKGSFYPSNRSLYLKICQYLVYLLILIALFSPESTYTSLLPLFQFVCFLLMFGGVAIIVRSNVDRLSGSVLVLIGGSIICSAGLFDFYMVYLSNSPIYVLPIAIMVSLLLQSQVIALKAAEAHRMVLQQAADLQQKNTEIQRNYTDIVLLQKKVQVEQAAKSSMASKAAHHLNNPIQAISGLAEANSFEMESIRESLEAMYPQPLERDLEAQNTIDRFHMRFMRIEENSRMIAKSIKRATNIANELRIVSDVHGLKVNRLSVEELWQALLEVISEDDSLSSKSITIGKLDSDTAKHETWLESISFANSIFYVLKEGLEAVPSCNQVHIATRLLAPEDGRGLLQIQATASAGLKDQDLSQWRELEFSKYLLLRYGATVNVLASSFQLSIEIRLPNAPVGLKDPAF